MLSFFHASEKYAHFLTGVGLVFFDVVFCFCGELFK